jgi:hypothetical protein
MKLKMKHLNLMVIAFGISLMASCYPYDSSYTDELDLTATLYDTTADFSKYKTFVIRDSVGLVSNYLSDSQRDDFYRPGGKSENLRDAIRERFKKEGYTEVDDLESADFAINNVIFKMESTSYYYPGWWYGYPGYWPGYWPPYYGYPGYPGYYPPYYGSYSTYYGTVLTEMIDAQSILDSEANDEPIDILWQVYINGVISSDLTYDSQRVARGYDEAFEQSPYLKN